MRASPSRTTVMRAVVQDAYGEAGDVLRPAEIERPSIGDDEVLVRVRAAGVDRGVWHLMAGLPYPVRLMGYGVRAPRNPVRGREVAGTVEELGAGVTTLQVGQDVFGIAEGSFAEFAAARADLLVPRPATVTAEQAAAVPISGLTALQAVRDAARVRPGMHVLVIGASGGVGTLALQIARAYGARVTGVCSMAKVDLVRDLGAERVLDHTRDDLGDDRYDVVLDAGGHRSLTRLRRALTPRGTLVIIGSETGGRWLGGLDRALRAPLLSRLVGQDLRALTSSENGADLAVLAELIGSGQVTPVVERTYPLAETAAAVAHLVEGRARGKVVVVP